MKYIMILIMCIPALVLLYGVSGEFKQWLNCDRISHWLKSDG